MEKLEVNQLHIFWVTGTPPRPQVSGGHQESGTEGAGGAWRGWGLAWCRGWLGPRKEAGGSLPEAGQLWGLGNSLGAPPPGTVPAAHSPGARLCRAAAPGTGRQGRRAVGMPGQPTRGQQGLWRSLAVSSRVTSKCPQSMARACWEGEAHVKGVGIDRSV